LLPVNIQAFLIRLLEEIPLDFGMSATDYELDLRLPLFEAQPDVAETF
jgi:hypothetical protein